MELPVAVLPELVVLDDEPEVPVAPVAAEVIVVAAPVRVAVGAGVPPYASSNEFCRLARAALALASREAYTETRAAPERVDCAAASRPASCVCTLT